MLTQAAQVLLLVGLGWVVLKTLRTLFGANPLDNIPGPPANSFLKGKLTQDVLAVS